MPRGVEGLAEIAAEVENVSTEEDGIYELIGRESMNLTLLAFPWPGEHGFFEAVVKHVPQDRAADYRGREGRSRHERLIDRPVEFVKCNRLRNARLTLSHDG